jgi:hypothetical protein
MSVETTSDTGEMRCARHPKVETRLACGRCETPICPKCMVMTDVGARCPDCAPARKLPQFELGPILILRAIAASLAAGAVLGAAWGYLLYDIGFFMIFVGIGIGYGVAEPVSWATNRRSGTSVQIIAVIGVFLAYFVRNAIAGEPLLPTNDIYGYLVVLIGSITAANRLRF